SDVCSSDLAPWRRVGLLPLMRLMSLMSLLRSLKLVAQRCMRASGLSRRLKLGEALVVVIPLRGLLPLLARQKLLERRPIGARLLLPLRGRLLAEKRRMTDRCGERLMPVDRIRRIIALRVGLLRIVALRVMLLRVLILRVLFLRVVIGLSLPRGV